LKANSFGDKVGDLEVKTVDNTLHHCLTEVEAGKPAKTHRNVEVQALADKQAVRLAEVEVWKVGKTVTDLKVALPVLTIAVIC